MVTKDQVVSIAYKLTDANGEVIDESSASEPLEYLHGHKNIITGLEQALEGHNVGDKLEVTVPAKDAYGEVDKEKFFAVDKSDLGGADVKVGMMARLQTEDGYIIAKVSAIQDKDIIFDANHPLAGQDLHFNVEIIALREATEEEIKNGGLHSCCSGSCESCGGCH